MNQSRANLFQPGFFTRLQMYRMPVKAALAQQTECLVGIQIIARIGEEIFHPCDFIDLFAEMGLHQAFVKFLP